MTTPTLREQIAATRAELAAKRQVMGLQQPTTTPKPPEPNGTPWRITREEAQDHTKYQNAREVAVKEGRIVEIVDSSHDDELSQHLRQIRLDENDVPISRSDSMNESDYQHLRMLAGQAGKKLRIVPDHLLADDYVKPNFDKPTNTEGANSTESND